MRIRILYTCQFSAAYGGVQHCLLDLVRHLDKTRFEPIVLCPPGGELPDLIAAAGVRVRTLGVGKYWSYSFRKPAGTLSDIWTVAREIIRLARSEGVRVVHAFEGMSFFAASLAKLYLKDLKIIWLDCGFNLYRYHFRVVMRWCFRHAARVVTITNIRLQQLLAEGLAPAKSAVLPCGTDFHLRPRGLAGAPARGNGETVCVGIVGRIVPIKNFELFLQAARIVAAAHPHVRFAIVGSQGLFQDEVAYYHRIRGLAKALALDDRVTFSPPVDDLVPVLDDFDLLVSSSHLETFGRTLIEAMSLSKPVVATAVGGVPEVVVDGEVGYLVPPGDAASLAEKISRLVADAPLRMAMGRKGYELVLKCYDIRAITKNWEQMYEDLLRK